MNIKDLNTAKQIINEMIKTKKSFDKAVERMGNEDVFGCSRAKTTTMNANIDKNAKVLEDYKPHLEKALKKILK